MIMDFKQIPEHERRVSQYDFFRVLAGKNRIRYYDRFKLAKLPGHTAGARMVVEVDLTTVKWCELGMRAMIVKEESFKCIPNYQQIWDILKSTRKLAKKLREGF